MTCTLAIVEQAVELITSGRCCHFSQLPERSGLSQTLASAKEKNSAELRPLHPTSAGMGFISKSKAAPSQLLRYLYISIQTARKMGAISLTIVADLKINRVEHLLHVTWIKGAVMRSGFGTFICLKLKWNQISIDYLYLHFVLNYENYFLFEVAVFPFLKYLLKVLYLQVKNTVDMDLMESNSLKHRPS